MDDSFDPPKRIWATRFGWHGKTPIVDSVEYVRADSAKALAKALLSLWRPANVTQMMHPDGVPFRRALKQISED